MAVRVITFPEGAAKTTLFSGRLVFGSMRMLALIFAAMLLARVFASVSFAVAVYVRAVPLIVVAARSFNAATLLRDKPAARNFSSGVASTSFGSRYFFRG